MKSLVFRLDHDSTQEPIFRESSDGVIVTNLMHPDLFSCRKLAPSITYFSDEEAAVPDDHLLDLQRRGVLGGDSFGIDVVIAAGTGEHGFPDLLDLPHAGAEDVGDLLLLEPGRRRC